MSTLLSINTPLPATIDPSDIPIKCLSLKTRTIISTLLNPPKVLRTDDLLYRDWRGLFCLVELKSEKLAIVGCDTDPTATILQLWQQYQHVPCNIKNLIDFLEKLDRYDIIDDTRDLIAEDMKLYVEKPEIVERNQPTIDFDSDKKILTNDDSERVNQGLDIQNYDAFVVFADEDINFATELIHTMENIYNLKLCAKERDLVAGHPFEHKAIIELISERCNRLIVIISPSYLKSPVNKFVVDFAQAIGIEAGIRKIIPCIYEKCELPLELRHYCMLNYSRSNRLISFWDKLNNSVRSRDMPRRRTGVQEPSPQESYQPESPPPDSYQSETYSVEVLSQDIPNLRPALVQPNNQLRPKRELNLSFKFPSESNLSTPELDESNRSASTNALCTSPQERVEEKKKTKSLFRKIFIPKRNKEKKNKSLIKTKTQVTV